MITNCGYHWHLQYDDGQRTSEEGRRLSLMQPTTLLGCHGFGSIFAAEMWGSGRFFFLDAMDFEKVKKPTKTRGFWKAKRFWETAKRSSDKSSELERVSLNEWTLLGLLHPSRAVVICCKWPSYPWDFPTVGSCQQVEVAFETVHGGIATSIYYFS